MNSLKVYLTLFVSLLFSSACIPSKIETEKITLEWVSSLSGLNGTFDHDSSTFKATLDRSNLNVTVDGVHITAALGLQAWVSLTGTKSRAVLLGDFPLKEAEVSGALRTLVDAGLSVTSLHNRFLLDSPRVFSLHFEAIGNAETLAKMMSTVFKALSENHFSAPLKHENKNLEPSKSTLDPKQLETLLWKGQFTDGVYRVSLGRGTILGNLKVGESTGAESWAAFAGSREYAVVNGDIATLEFEIPFVLKDLLKAGIQITSIHTHMTQEKPRLVFIHFWGTGPIEVLAQGVKAAIWEKEHFQAQ